MRYSLPDEEVAGRRTRRLQTITISLPVLALISLAQPQFYVKLSKAPVNTTWTS
jgi:hypothetical protein